MKSINMRLGPHDTELPSVVPATPVMHRGMLLFFSITILSGVNSSIGGVKASRCLKLSGNGEKLFKGGLGEGPGRDGQICDESAISGLVAAPASTF